MSDEVEFAGPEADYTAEWEPQYAWPATERRRARPVIPISKSELGDLRRYRRARDLARRWLAEDEDVVMQDIIDALLG